jgi:ArsR family transcriptional regulator, arsenate/arsenite/antimonite-responsive transcriptional repressor
MTTKPASSVDRMFRAFSDRTRLRILHLLVPGELCVCHLVDALDLPQPKVSRHLAYLRRTGLVLARKEGLWIYYRLARAQGEFHKKLLECLSSCFEDVSELRDDRERLKRCCGGKCR